MAIINRDRYRHFNIQMLIRVIGWLVMIESLFMLIPMLVSLYYGESDWRIFLFTMSATLLAGGLMSQLARPSSTSLGKREGFLLTASVWIIFSIFGMMPFIFCATPYTVSQAFTEAMSGLTTTGATVIGDINHLSNGIKFWRCMMQWIGGMGIILFTIAVIPMLNHSGGMNLFNAEVTGITHGKIRPRISQTAISLWTVYGLLTAICILMLWIGPMNLYESVTHAMSTIATGGFTIYTDGIDHYHSNYVKIVTTIFMFLGSINFAIIFALAHGHFKSLQHDEPHKVFLIIVIVLSVIMYVSEYFNHCIDNWYDSAVDTVFMVVSAISSTSYTIEGIESWGLMTIALLFLLIFLGGCAGSTSGGAKIDRIIVLFKFMRNEIWQALQPNNVVTVKLSGKILPIGLVEKVVAFLAIYICIIIAGALALTIMGIPIAEALITTITCISNSGTCVDIGAYGGSLVQIPAAGKIMLSIIMMTGRLEIFTVLVLFTGNFWHK